MLMFSCHKRVRGTSKWIKRELLEMEEGRGKEEAKQLLQVQYVWSVEKVFCWAFEYFNIEAQVEKSIPNK